MSSGFYLTSGFFYINMGAEMMFVLANRMAAQKIDMNSVGLKIVCDIILKLYNPKMMKDLLEPKKPISISSFYVIFSKIANCSALNLDHPSMEKLFYLVLMTFKKQLLYSLSCVHFNDIKAIVKKSTQVLQALESSKNSFMEMGLKMTYVQYFQVREELLSMLEFYRNKILLFLEIGLQDQEGKMIRINRVSHNRHIIGTGINHSDIMFDLPKDQIPHQHLEYKNYESWETDLGKDDYDNIRGSSKFYNKQSFSQQKSITNFLNIKHNDLQSFQIQLDQFSKKSTKNIQVTEKLPQQMQSNLTKIENDLLTKITQEINDIAMVESKQSGEEEIDLLDIMDN